MTLKRYFLAPNVINGEIENGSISVYILVACHISNDKAMEQESENQLKIQDNYPKYVIYMNPMLRPQNHEGINHLTLRQFLMSGDSQLIAAQFRDFQDALGRIIHLSMSG